jgi:hypothetical protein
MTSISTMSMSRFGGARQSTNRGADAVAHVPKRRSD